MLFHNFKIKDGTYTKTIYSMIKDQQYNEALQILSGVLTGNPNSRACLSLLAYCYFYTQDFASAASCYERLVALAPEEQDYQLYYAQCLYQACLYQDALRVVSQIEEPSVQPKVRKLKAAIKYGEEDLVSAKVMMENSPEDDPDTEINHGCLLYKEMRYEEALQKFTTALVVLGYNPHLSYNVALCYYRLKEYAPALKHIADIIERGIREHPELSVGMATEGIEVRSVGNTLTLHETALIEAFNLKAAIEYQLNNLETAREALTDMPPRSEEELDAVTLHNQALMNMESKPHEGFEKLQFLLQQNQFPPETLGNLLLLYSRYQCFDLAADVLADNAHLTHKFEKLQFLLQQNPFPPETLGNLLLLYSRYQCFDLAADVLADNAHLTHKYLSPYLYDFLDALITQQSSPEEAYRKFDELASRHTDVLRKATRRVQEARDSHNDAAVKKAVLEYEDTLDRYIPVLMSQAKIYWDLEQYWQVENIFHKSVEFCNENETWRLHVAHVLFMQDNKFKEAAGFYEPIVKKHYNNILGASAIVLANLCVSYIMTGQNDEAEDLMRKIEKEEERLAYSDPDKKVFHLCIVNLVIGTLYCAKGNYEFGISRLIKSLEPYNKKLGIDTWFYAKRCMLSLIENLSKHMISARDTFFQECILFLEQCEVHGKEVKTVAENPLDEPTVHNGKDTVTCEARHLKALFLKLQMS